MNNVIKLQIIFAMMMLCGSNVFAQTNLAGRTYYNANILADEMNKMMQEIDQKVPQAKAKAYAKFEKKKGRKPTEKEKAVLEKELNEAVAEARAVKKGMTTAITVDFKTDKDAVMNADVKISDEALKAAGIGWLKRKAMKAALAVAPSKSKCTYIVKNNQIILDDSGEKDTLTLSTDGKFLYGKFDKKTNFKLTRTK
ncbi:MAG: hypothetical protein IKY01_09345 [Prevotella sp.]|nr:hypothetical protein [Prevotella sp.]